MDELTGGEAVAETLRAAGVDHVFGIISVHNLPIYDALARDERITVVPTRHEQGAVHAADGYARATGKLGVALTSTGPGAANSMGGLFEAGYASSPVLMLTGQVHTSYLGKGRGYIHEAERQIDMLRSVCRRAETVQHRDELSDVLQFVIADILTGRPKPGAVEIPVDIQYASGAHRVIAPIERRAITPDVAALEQAWDVLKEAQRPLIWAGGGVNAAGAHAALQELAELLGAPVLTTTEGRGAIPEDHPLALGPNSEMGAMVPTIEEADVVLAVGTRFQMASSIQQGMVIPGRLVHIDADPGVIGRNHRPEVGVVADATLALESLVQWAGGHTPGTEDEFVERARAGRRAAEESSHAGMGSDHQRIAATIRELLPRDANLVKDATIAAYVWANRVLPVYAPRTSLRPTSMAIGPGLGLSIGAAVGTGRPTVLVQGDGGLMLSLGELATAVERQVPLIVCVFNDGGYGILRWMQDVMLEGRRAGVDLATPDFAGLARSVGMEAEQVEDVEQFAKAFERAVGEGGPWLLDIDLSALEPMEVRPQRPRGRPA